MLDVLVTVVGDVCEEVFVYEGVSTTSFVMSITGGNDLSEGPGP